MPAPESPPSRASSAADARWERAGRLNAVGTIAADAAHEIRNPLTSVVANLSWVMDRLADRSIEVALGDDAHALRGALGEALEGAFRVRDVVDDLETFGRLDGTAVAVDVGRALDVAIRLLRAAAGRRFVLVERREPVAPVLADPPRLAQALVHLLWDALHESGQPPATGRVELRTRPSDGASIVEIAAHPPSGEAAARRLELRGHADAGPGLAACRDLVHELGGAVRTRVDAAGAKVVEVRLRVAPDGEQGRTRSYPSSPPVRPRRVLVVDDEPLVLRAIARTLGREHHVVTTSGARQALAVLERDATFDAILCDLMMPDGNGRELHDEVVRRWPALAARLWFLSGGAFTPELISFAEKMAARVLQKPIESRRLRALVASLP